MSGSGENDESRTIGTSIPRREDGPYLTGEAEYTDDIHPPDVLHLAVLRSRYAHAEIVDVDASTVKERNDVLTVLTRSDLEDADMPGTIPIG